MYYTLVFSILVPSVTWPTKTMMVGSGPRHDSAVEYDMCVVFIVFVGAAPRSLLILHSL